MHSTVNYYEVMLSKELSKLNKEIEELEAALLALEIINVKFYISRGDAEQAALFARRAARWAFFGLEIHRP